MKVSIITVVRNDCVGLARTIASVRMQSHREFEFIVVDGESNDGSVNVIETNLDLISYWISEADRGVYDAMNKGLQRATGEFVLFLNAGDELLEAGSLATAVEAARIHPKADVLYFCATRGDATPAGSFDRHSAIQFDSVGNHQAVLVRTNIHQNFTFNTNYRIKADRDVQLRIYQTGSSAVSIPKAISRFEGGGISSRAIPQKEWENILICWNNRVGLFWTSVALCLAATRVSLYALTRVFGLEWDKAKSLFRPKARTPVANIGQIA